MRGRGIYARSKEAPQRRGGSIQAMKEPEHGSGGAERPMPSPTRTSKGPAPVLVAVDFSADSEDALVWAFDHARRMDAPLEVLHVIHDPADAPGTYRSDNGDPLEPMTDVAERKLAAFLDDVSSRHPNLSERSGMRTACVSCLPVETILRTAQDRGARLLVVGCRRKIGAARLLFGSTSHRVAQKARIPAMKSWPLIANGPEWSRIVPR